MILDSSFGVILFVSESLKSGQKRLQSLLWGNHGGGIAFSFLPKHTLWK